MICGWPALEEDPRSKAHKSNRFRKGLMARTRRRFNFNSVVGTVPMILVSVGVFVIGIAFTFFWSFTSSKLFPNYDFVGLQQYVRLWGSDRWHVSVYNIWIFGLLTIVGNLVFGFLLAVFMDQNVRNEDLLRSIFLYPFAMSLIVTGLVWQWALDPNLGLQAAMHHWGWASFEFAPLVDVNTAIYGLVVAGIWQGSGVSMAIMLAGLRGIDAEIWKAAKVDGIPNWRTYLFIALPMMRGALATAFVLQCVSVVRVYDLIIAMTGGGPGISTNMPAVYVIDMITSSQNVGQGMAAATMMLVPIIVLLSIVGLVGWRRRVRAGASA
jgi:glucose/mannose transport system permease protein